MFVWNGLFIRVVEPRDLEAIRSLRNDPTTWVNLTDVRLITGPMQEAWFTKTAQASDRKYFVVGDEAHDFIGIVRCDEIDHLNRSMRVGCDIAPKLRGQRYGSRVYDLLLKYCFDYLNMHRLWLLVIETNAVARQLYTRKSFQEEGRYREALFRDGQYHDYIVMSLLEQDYRAGQ
jgi:RimJ/RimL family protein N-acetyltransferase